MQLPKKHFPTGFTLVELLVTIGIIVILAAGGMTVYTTSQKRGRDARRIADIKSVQNSFEQYYIANDGYAANCSTMATDIQGGMPLGVPPYDYATYCPDTTQYCVCSQMEVAGKGNASDFSCTFAAEGNFYCVKNLQ